MSLGWRFDVFFQTKSHNVYHIMIQRNSHIRMRLRESVFSTFSKMYHSRLLEMAAAMANRKQNATPRLAKDPARTPLHYHAPISFGIHPFSSFRNPISSMIAGCQPSELLHAMQTVIFFMQRGPWGALQFSAVFKESNMPSARKSNNTWDIQTFAL